MDTGRTESEAEDRAGSPGPGTESHAAQAEAAADAGTARPESTGEHGPTEVHRPDPEAAGPAGADRTGDTAPPAGAPGVPAGDGAQSAGRPEATTGAELSGRPEASADAPTPSPNAAEKPPRRATPAWIRCLARTWRHPYLRWPKRIAVTLLLVLLLPTLAAGIALRVNYAGDLAPGTQTRNRDAIWLGHAWVDGRKGDADVKALAARLRSTGIRDLYVHAGPLEHDGTLPATAYASAGWLIAAVHRQLDGVRVQAWLGDELASEGPVGLRLERDATRDAVVRSTRQILAAGFDGVHFDLEPLHSGNRDYLSLLDDLHRVTKARGVPLSVAAHQIDPLPAANSVRGALTGHPKWWSQSYFGQVARRVDQIAVMSYDTAMPLESLYGGYVAQQTSLALEVTPKSTDLLMGLPFFHEDDMSHHGSAETVAAAVRGTRLGLSRTDRRREHFGVALYVDFAATESDWTAYREGWVR
ncbi:hypothetical protein [Streptomyces sp. NBC_01236]|uniref:hypothetical protein n=1 Tax=Streptomyces sp. NBC_01236 TaxID=2903789 RepID=UPI003FA3749E